MAGVAEQLLHPLSQFSNSAPMAAPAQPATAPPPPPLEIHICSPGDDGADGEPVWHGRLDSLDSGSLDIDIERVIEAEVVAGAGRASVELQFSDAFQWRPPPVVPVPTMAATAAAIAGAAAAAATGAAGAVEGEGITGAPGAPVAKKEGIVRTMPHGFQMPDSLQSPAGATIEPGEKVIPTATPAFAFAVPAFAFAVPSAEAPGDSNDDEETGSDGGGSATGSEGSRRSHTTARALAASTMTVATAAAAAASAHPPPRPARRRPAASVAPLPAGSIGGSNAAPEPKRPCTCRKSRCLKMYCACFSLGALCAGGTCKCVGCLNTADHPEDRRQAVEDARKRNRNAFRPVPRPPKDRKAVAAAACGCANAGRHHPGKRPCAGEACRCAECAVCSGTGGARGDDRALAAAVVAAAAEAAAATAAASAAAAAASAEVTRRKLQRRSRHPAAAAGAAVAAATASSGGEEDMEVDVSAAAPLA